MSALSALVLDFDGVILLSNEAKDRAMERILRKFPEKFDEAWAFHARHNAIDRFEKFRRFVFEVLRDPRGQSLVDELLIEFKEAARSELLKCRLGNGAREFLSTMSKRYPLYVASATPLVELEWIIGQLGLSGFFKRLYGSDRKKSDVLLELAREWNVGPSSLLMIGDSPEDLGSAQKAGVQFIGCRGRSDFKDYAGHVFDDLEGIGKFLGESK